MCEPCRPPSQKGKCPPSNLRTINLAGHAKPSKHHLENIYSQCESAKSRIVNIPERPFGPTFLYPCSKDDLLRIKCKKLDPVIKPCPPHGKGIYLMKALAIAGTIYFTWREGIWGDQTDVLECVKRWGQYGKSFFSGVPPKFDACGKVVIPPRNCEDDSNDVLRKIYLGYKDYITSSFNGIIMLPTYLKCEYIEYKAKKRKELIDMENKIKAASL